MRYSFFGVLILAVAFLSSCTSSEDSQPSSSAEVGTYTSVAALKDAAVSSGYTCDSWNQDNKVNGAIESGTCSSKDAFSLYSDQESRDAITDNLENFYSVLKPDHPEYVLLGKWWIINTDIDFDSLSMISAVIGGEPYLVYTPPEPTPTPSPAPKPAVEHQEYSGDGDDVIDVSITEPAMVTFSCPECTRNTVLKTNGRESLLVNTIGSYSGSHVINVYDGSITTEFTITARSYWTLTVDDITQAPVFTAAGSGAGDTLIWMNSTFSRAQITNDGSSNFIVHCYGSSSSRSLVVNEIGAYSGVKPMTGPCLVQVESTGNWSITPQ